MTADPVRISGQQRLQTEREPQQSSELKKITSKRLDRDTKASKSRLPGEPLKASSAKAIFRALDQRGVKYLVAGGIAVNAYGYLRFTKDIDFVIQLLPENIAQAFVALESIGYHPNVPITAEEFSQLENRQRWVEKKDMKVLQFWSDQHRETPVDVFISVPFDFEKELAAATFKQLRDIGSLPIVTLQTLVSLKRAANREQDRIDLDNLRLLYPEEIPHA